VCITDTQRRCVNSSECGSGKACVNNLCYDDCTRSGTCASKVSTCSSPLLLGTSTEVRVCYPDTSRKPECTKNLDCTGGETCVNGICRTTCTKTEDCAACSDGHVCKDTFCMTAEEAQKQCSLNSQCASGKYCLNQQCVTL